VVGEVFHRVLDLLMSRKTGTHHPTAETAVCESVVVTQSAHQQRSAAHWECPACGLGLRPDDSVVVVRLRPFHASCAEASFTDRATWEHTDAITLSQWARGIAWRSS
jgi:hypothetical protein